MQTRALPGPRHAHVGGDGAQEPHGGFGPDGMPRQLPKHLQQEKERQQRERGYLPPESDDDAEEGNGITKMYDLLWPIAFWCVTAINLMTFAAASFSMAGSYDVWKQLHSGGVTVGFIALMIVVDKWIIRGPNGLPRFHKPRQE